MTDGKGETPDPNEKTGETPAPPETGDVDGLKTALRSERSSRTTAEKRARELEARVRELEDRDKSDSERLTARLAESERKASEAVTTALRYEFAAKHGLDFEAAQHITGSTPEEIEASATHLAEFVTKRTGKPAGNFDGGARERPDEKVAPEQAHNAWLLSALGRTNA